MGQTKHVRSFSIETYQYQAEHNPSHLTPARCQIGVLLEYYTNPGVLYKQVYTDMVMITLSRVAQAGCWLSCHSSQSMVGVW